MLSYLSEVLRTDRKIKLQDVGFPPPHEMIIPLLSSMWSKRGAEEGKARAGAQASSHAAGKITKTLEAAWL